MEADTIARSLAQRIDAVEEAYEFMLAYAAQGTTGEDRGDAAPIRVFLRQLAAALDGLSPAVVIAADGLTPALAKAWMAFAEILADDAGKALRAVQLVLAHPSIGSQLVDNLNASHHLRAVMTDLFLFDEAGKPPAV